MLESIEGKRGLPATARPISRRRACSGRPTLNPQCRNPVSGWREHHREGSRLVRRSGKARGEGISLVLGFGAACAIPAVKQAPAGITVNELIAEYCGGMQEGHALKAAWLPGWRLGRAAARVTGRRAAGFRPARPARRLRRLACDRDPFSDHDDLRSVALNLMRFFRHESCGQCTPCRAGTQEDRATPRRRAAGRRRFSMISRWSCAMPRSAGSARQRPTR